jgi:hypothetical protein
MVGARYQREETTYVIEARWIANVVLPTGQVIGGDPFDVGQHTAPFTVTVAPGSYPLREWVAVLFRQEEEWQRRVAELQLVVVGEPARRWDPAVVPGQDVTTLDPDGYFGYIVDGGIGAFVDPTALQALDEWNWERVNTEFLDGAWITAPVPGLRTVVADEGSGANVVVTESGWGDGAYPTFIGYPAEGPVASFVTAFLRRADLSARRWSGADLWVWRLTSASCAAGTGGVRENRRPHGT